MNESSIIVRQATDLLQRERRAANVSQQALADELGLTRQTVGQKLQAGDMKLSEFVAMALSVGARPHELIAKAEKRASAALADVKEA